jgi:hypothetical protein
VTITVAGIGTGTLTDTGYAFVAQAGAASIAGIGDDTILDDILDTYNAGFAAYGLTTSIGPLSGGPGGNPSRVFPTTFGDFILSSNTNPDDPSTFTAVTGTPEPRTLVLLGAGIGLLGLLRRRRQA